MGSLTISNVTKTFGSTEVLKGINIDIADGEFLILVGPSGCGKSTLMNTIAGLEEVTSGQLLLAGEDVTDRSPKGQRYRDGVSVVRALPDNECCT